MYCIRCSVICKIVFCSESPDIPDNAGSKTTRRRTQAIAKRYAFHANAIKGNIVINEWGGLLTRMFIKTSTWEVE